MPQLSKQSIAATAGVQPCHAVLLACQGVTGGGDKSLVYWLPDPPSEGAHVVLI